MLPKERVQAVFEGKTTDRVPVHHIGFSSRVASVVLGREAHVGGGIQQWRESVALWRGESAHREFVERSFRDAIDLALALGQDIVRPEYWRLSQKPSQRIDEFTFRYGNEADWVVRRFDPKTELYQEIDSFPKKATTLETLRERVAAEEKAVESYQPTEAAYATPLRAQAEVGAERVVRVGGVSTSVPYQPVWLEAVATEPELVERLLDVQAERAVRNVAFLVAKGFQYFWGGGDFASNQGPFYSPKAFHRLMLPRLKRIAETCHRHGAYFLFASDGNLWPVADDLFGASGVDGFYEIDGRAGMDLAVLRRRFPILALVGGNIASFTLHHGTKEQVAEETLSCLDEAKRNGRIIVGCSNQIVSRTPIENFLTMTELLNKHR